MDIISVAPGVGSLVAMRALFPYLGYARGLFLMLFVSAGACAGSAVAPRGAAVAAAGFFATIGWGVYPSMTGLLTPEEDQEHQGHLQAALYALTTLGSMIALYGYLWLYTRFYPDGLKPNSAEMDRDYAADMIWWVSAGLMLVAALAALAAGDGSTARHKLRASPAADAPDASS